MWLVKIKVTFLWFWSFHVVISLTNFIFSFTYPLLNNFVTAWVLSRILKKPITWQLTILTHSCTSKLNCKFSKSWFIPDFDVLDHKQFWIEDTYLGRVVRSPSMCPTAEPRRRCHSCQTCHSTSPWVLHQHLCVTDRSVDAGRKSDHQCRLAAQSESRTRSSIAKQSDQ